MSKFEKAVKVIHDIPTEDGFKTDFDFNIDKLLGKVENSENIPGVLKQVDTAGNSGYRVSWSNMVCRNL